MSSKSLDTETLSCISEFFARDDALRDLRAYQRYMARTGLPDFEHGPARHHDAIIDRLEALERGDIARLMIAMPPGSAKTTWANINFVSWYAARNRQHQIITASATVQLAEEFSGRRKRAMATREWSRLTDLEVDGKQATSKFRYGKGGSQLAVGVGSSVVGNRADLFVLDDAVASLEQILSPATREKMHGWWMGEASTRLKKDGKVLVIGTRWMSDDLMGRLLEAEPDQWEVLTLPMLCTDPNNDALGRELDEPLWPEWYTATRLKEAQRDPVLWQSLWQQQPLNQSGDWLDPNALNIVDRPSVPDALSIYVALDLAATTSDTSDYTCIGVAGVDHRRHIYILDWFRARIASEEIVEKLRLLREEWNPLEFLVDDDLGSRHFARLAASMSMLKGGVPLVPRLIPIRGKSKEERAIPFQSLARQGFIHTVSGPWVPELLKEISTFPRVGRGFHDDQIDTLSLLANFHTRMSPGRTPEIHCTPEPIHGFMQEINGRLYTRASLEEMWNENDRSRSSGILRI